ncbi:MAG: integrase family protein [Nitrococcus sp.]|nr:integrase family protein [Nitrococcus sp.]
MATAKNTSNRINFTKGRVDAFTCPRGRTEAFLWDTGVPGLGLRARASGNRAYIFQTRLHDRSVRCTIGSPEAWDIEQARAEARRLRVLVDSGVHPNNEKRERELVAEAERQEQSRAVITLGGVWPAYMAARRDDWSERHYAAHANVMQAPGLPRKRSKKLTVAGPLYALHTEKLADLTPERLAAWLEREKKSRPTTAALAYRVLRACLVWVSEQTAYRGLVDPATLFNKAVRRAVPRVKPKTDVLQREQLAPWFETVRAINNPVIAAYLQGLLLTGARSGELARLRWSDADFEWRSLRIRDKVEGEREIPLTPYLARLLNALPRSRGLKDGTNERLTYVFSSPRAAGGYLADATHVHARALKAAGLPHVTLHGLRRSFGTLSEWVECPVGVVAQIQGHKPSALAEKHYRRRPLDLLRKWHTQIEGWILAEAGIKQPSADAGRLRVVK